MKINEAIAKRLNDLSNDKELAQKIANDNQLSTNKIASVSYLTQSTVQHLTDGRSKNPKTLTIARICGGLDIKLKDFFDDPVFDDIDLEN